MAVARTAHHHGEPRPVQWFRQRTRESRIMIVLVALTAGLTGLDVYLHQVG